MKPQPILAGVLLPTMAFAFPGMIPGQSKEEMLRMLRERDAPQELEDRGLVSSVVGTVTATLTTLINDVEGLLGSVASNVSPDNARPQPGYVFKAPGPNDSRGPCPGLNLLANYGYLPRNGYVNFGEVVNATAVGFNMGTVTNTSTDLATILAVFAVLADGDLATESWYLGSNNGVGGLNRHSTVEADISPNREDFYLGCGDNHHLSSRLFKQNTILAAQGSKQFDLATMTKQYDANAAFSKLYNPYLYYFPFPSIVSFAAFAFYPNFFSNGTYGAGGVANYESISAIMGAQFNKKTGNFEYVPERWPKNWYRRSTEYGAVAALTEGIAIYLTNPVGMPFGQLGTDNLNAQTVLCDVYQGVDSIVPLFLSGTTQSVADGVTWVLSKLDPVFDGTTLGCPSTTISENFYTFNDTRAGGPVNPPPSVQSNTGNNVYSKVYFTATPTAPLCAHTNSA